MKLTDHVLQRYIERFNPNLQSVTDIRERLTRAKKAVIEILKAASYVSDDRRGVLLHSKIHKCNLIIRGKKLITLYQPDAKVKEREDKRKVNLT